MNVLKHIGEPIAVVVKDTFDIHCLNSLQFHTAYNRCFSSTLTENPLIDSAC